MSEKTPLLILASTSPRRKEILERCGIPFTILSESIDERPLPDEKPLDFATRMAESKAIATQNQHSVPHAYFLGADTIVVLDDTIYGKPADEQEACRFLGELQGRTHRVITAFALVDENGKIIVSEHDSSEVTIKTLSPEKIRSYVGTGEPMDKAGAYAAQGLGSRMIEKIQGSQNNVIGLPIEKILPHLRKIGII